MVYTAFGKPPIIAGNLVHKQIKSAASYDATTSLYFDHDSITCGQLFHTVVNTITYMLRLLAFPLYIILVIIAAFAAVFIPGREVVPPSTLRGGGEEAQLGGNEDGPRQSRIKHVIPQANAMRELWPIFDKYNTARIAKEEYRKDRTYDYVLDDMFSKFDIKPSAADGLLDICCNPGMFSMYVMRNARLSNTKIQTWGVSLPVAQNGYAPAPELAGFDEYHPIDIDILKDSTELAQVPKVGMVYMACFVAHNAGVTERELYYSSFDIMDRKLMVGGWYITYFSFRYDAVLLLDTLELLSGMFNDAPILYKHPKHTAGLSGVYIICRGRNDKPLGVTKQSYQSGDIWGEEILTRYGSQINDIYHTIACYHIGLIGKSIEPAVRYSHGATKYSRDRSSTRS